jgi:hypothetical protein
MREPQQRDHILVPVMWECDRELLYPSRISKRQPSLITRRRLRVTDRTDRRARTAEELWPVTTHTRIVARIILDIGKGDLVTGITRRLVFFRRM